MEATRRAEEWVAYYANCDIQFAKDWWIRGLETAQEWLRLTKSASVSQQEVSSLLATAKANQHNGSGWGIMALLMYSWAKQSGHEVPPLEDYLDWGRRAPFPRKSWWKSRLIGLQRRFKRLRSFWPTA